jgi:hypothetical protein
MLPWVKAFFRLQKTEPREQVLVDVERVSCRRRSGRIDTVRWTELQMVGVETTDAGPFVEDVYFYLEGPEYGFHIPQSAEGTTELVGRFADLPGFDSISFASAMSSTDNARFVCWKRCDA